MHTDGYGYPYPQNGHPPPAPNAQVIYQQPVQQVTQAPQVQQVQQPIQSPVNQFNVAQFTMDTDTLMLLRSIPGQYTDFVINFGIKLAFEQSLIKNYVTSFKTETNDNGVVVPSNTGNVGSQEVNKTNSTMSPNPVVSGFGNVSSGNIGTEPAAAGGFKSW